MQVKKCFGTGTHLQEVGNKGKSISCQEKAAEAKAKGVAGVKTVYKYGVAFRKKLKLLPDKERENNGQ